MGFSARFIFIQPPDPQTMQEGEYSEEVLARAKEWAEHATATPGFYDASIADSIEALEALVCVTELESNGVEPPNEDDVAMEDAAAAGDA